MNANVIRNLAIASTLMQISIGSPAASGERGGDAPNAEASKKAIIRQVLAAHKLAYSLGAYGNERAKQCDELYKGLRGDSPIEFIEPTERATQCNDNGIRELVSCSQIDPK